MAEAPARRWYSARELGAALSIKPKTLFSLAARGRLPKGSVIRLGKQLRFDLAAIENGLAIERGRKGGA